MTRRAALALPLAGLACHALATPRAGPEETLAALEARHGGRLGVAALDMSSGRSFGRRADERFPVLSVFKAFSAALALSHVERETASLSERIAVRREDVVENSPVVETRVGADMTIAEICHAAVTRSDNAAGNLLLRRFGGPEGLTAFMRSIGDRTTRLDRFELELNEAAEGDLRDTTTPTAALGSLRTLVFGDTLSPASRATLDGWLSASTTGGKRLKAGFPADWRVGDKTGTGHNGATNDVAIARRPDGTVILVAAFYCWSAAAPAERNAVVADVGRLATATFG